MKAEDDVERFLRKYESRAELSRDKFYAKMPRFHMGRIYDFDPHSPIADFAIEREPYVEVLMPKHRFQDLVERERWISKMEEEAAYYKKWYIEELEDDKVRSQNPVVKQAFEKYRMLLELCRK